MVEDKREEGLRELLVKLILREDRKSKKKKEMRRNKVR